MKYNPLPTFILLFGFVPVAFAGSIRCGGHIFQGGEEQPVLQSQILEKCGEPTSKTYGVWIYVRDNVTYTLQFNSDNQLETVTQQVQE